jgi:transcriptional regulator with XRE-family HTH domain
MDNRDEVSAFLRSRRDKLTPVQVGLPDYGTRRAAGLRRGEVAMLAGVSVEYYTRLERGNLAGVSESVLELDHQTMDVPGDAGQTMAFYSAPPGSAAADSLALLASWSATQDKAQDAPEGAERLN